MTPAEWAFAQMFADRINDTQLGGAFAQYEELLHNRPADRGRLEGVLRGHYGDDYIAMWRGWRIRHSVS